MAVAIVATAHTGTSSVTVSLSGLTVGKEMRITRDGVVIKVLVAAAATATFEDYLAPFGADLVYAVTSSTGAVSATAAVVRLPWHVSTAVPAFTTDTGLWPIIREPGAPSRGAIKVPVADYSGVFGIRATVTPIIGSGYPVVANDVRQVKRFSMTLLTSSADMRRHLLPFFQNGKVLHVRAPCVNALDNVFFKCLTLSETIEDRTRPNLVTWQLECQQVRAVPGWGVVDAVAGERTWGEVRRAIPTWGQVLAKGTWGHVLVDDTARDYSTHPVSDGGSW